MTPKFFVVPQTKTSWTRKACPTGVVTSGVETRGVKAIYLNNVTKGPNFHNWKERLRHKQNSTTDLVGDRYYEEGNRFGYVYFKGACPTDKTKTGYVSASGLMVDPVHAPSSPPEGFPSSRAFNLALAEYVKQVRAAQTSFASGTFAGELRETIRGIIHPAQALRQGIGSYLNSLAKRRRFIKTATEATKVISGTYLEYTFGWKPLLSDVESAAKALARYHNDDFGRNSTFVKGEATSPEHYADRGPCNGYFIGGRFIDRGYVKVKFYGRVNVRNTGKTSLGGLAHSQLFGLDFHNFVPTLWELLPYSFVIDYFVNIGDIINAASLNTSQIAWTSYTVISVNSRQVESWRVNPPDPLWEQDVGLPDVKTLRVHVSRAHEYAGSLVPSLEFSIPAAKPLLNIGALAAQFAASRNYFKRFQY